MTPPPRHHSNPRAAAPTPGRGGRRWAGIAFVLVGVALVLAALSLFVFNKQESANAGHEAEALLAEVLPLIDEQRGNPDAPAELTVGGYSCLGYLTIPDLGVELPVLADWDYDRLNVAPCRQFGSVRTGDLVIAAHNFDTHFGRLGELPEGAEVRFTGTDGATTRYAVAAKAQVAPDDVERVRDSGHPLVLYTCTYDGADRTTVFCTIQAQ